MSADEKLLLRVHSRIRSDPQWIELRLNAPVTIENRRREFCIVISAEHADVDDDHVRVDTQLLVVSYLAVRTSPGVVGLLEDPIGREGGQSFEATESGIGKLPDDYRQFLVLGAAEIARETNRALSAALWRTGTRSGPPRVTVHPGRLFWSRPITRGVGPEWRQVPTGAIALDLPDLARFELTPDAANMVSQLLDEGEEEPLGHDLLREAWRIHESNPRSALVIAVAGVEVGVKAFVARALPQTEWLLRNVPSPPLLKFLRELLPTVRSSAPSHDFVPPLDRALVRSIQSAVEKRNSLVHGGFVEIQLSELVTFFTQARRLLYQLDYHSGREWALALEEDKAFYAP